VYLACQSSGSDSGGDHLARELLPWGEIGQVINRTDEDNDNHSDSKVKIDRDGARCANDDANYQCRPTDCPSIFMCNKSPATACAQDTDGAKGSAGRRDQTSCNQK
jgi:hypothetical protein